MVTRTIIDVLHDTFLCSKCGRCCSRGGQIKITPAEAQAIADYLDVDMSDMSLFPFKGISEDPDYLYLEVCNPCFFWDKLNKTCLINEVKPDMCRDYPWKLFKESDCTLRDVLVCPEAIMCLAAVLTLPVEE